MQKLDFRCNGNGCAKAFQCRRFLTWPYSKNSPVPFAAFDMRDTVEGDGFLLRIMTPIRVESEGGEA